MKISELYTKYNIDYYDFINFLRENKMEFRETLWGDAIVDDSKVDDYVDAFLEKEKEKKKSEEEEAMRLAEEAEQQAMEDKIKKKAMSEMLITSGFNFDGYTIKKYSGYISGDDAISVDRGLSFMGIGGDKARDELMASLAKIRRNALRELKEAAYDLGCNAVIGVDFDYITLDPQTHDLVGGTKLQPYVFGVTANGNAVIIEKDED